MTTCFAICFAGVGTTAVSRAGSALVYLGEPLPISGFTPELKLFFRKTMAHELPSFCQYWRRLKVATFWGIDILSEETHDHIFAALGI